MLCIDINVLYVHIALVVILCFLSQVAKSMGPGHTVVTCLCDSGQVGLYKNHFTRSYCVQ